jgi:hypothetical protein
MFELFTTKVERVLPDGFVVHVKDGLFSVSAVTY